MIRILLYTHKTKPIQYLKEIADQFDEKSYIFKRIYTHRLIGSSRDSIENIKSIELL